MKKLIKKYQYLIKGFKELVDECEAKGLENLDSQETEYYGAWLGKAEILEEVIEDLKKIDTND